VISYVIADVLFYLVEKTNVVIVSPLREKKPHLT